MGVARIGSPGQRPGKGNRKKTAALKGQHQSIPHVSFVEFDARIAQQSPVFVLERFGAMMLFLILDVNPRLYSMILTNGKRRISALPMELSQRPVKRLNELR